MMTVAQTLASAARALEGVTETPRLDAEILLAHALGVSRAGLLSRLQDVAGESSFPELLDRRVRAEPIAYILGEWEFFSLPFYTEAPILVPRPETEHLVEAVLDVKPARVADVCTGTGCVAVAVAKNLPGAAVVATDMNVLAVKLAKRNAARNGVGERVAVFEGDLLAPVRGLGPFDAICSNPPYVEDSAWETLSPNITQYEDPAALLAGPEGLDAIRRLVVEARPLLVSGGLLAIEIGMGQYDAVSKLVDDAGYGDVAARRDLAGIDRIVTGRRRAT